MKVSNDGEGHLDKALSDGDEEYMPENDSEAGCRFDTSEEEEEEEGSQRRCGRV